MQGNYGSPMMSGMPATPPQEAAEAPAAPMEAMPAPAPASPRMTKQRVIDAFATLKEYQGKKKNLENRIVENDKWYRLHHWENITEKPNAAPQRSAWLLNGILNKHADAMDNYPMPNILPREESDKSTAITLSEVLPVVLDQNDFETVYSDAWWQKLQSGTAVYGVFWNAQKLNGLGDIEVRPIDLINLFWEPGVKDIQHSRNLFHVEEQSNEAIKAQYPQLEGKLGSSGFALAEYASDDPIDHSKKSLVVDWYYKTIKGSKTILHFCKFCGGEILYSSEDDPQCADTGFYAHGMYPFVFDVLFPIKESPSGFGYIDIGRDAQERIDTLGASIVKNAKMRAGKRYFIKKNGNVNEEEFSDWTKDIVHVESGAIGEQGDTSIRPIQVEALGGDVMNAYNGMIDELKETIGNRDFSQGGTTSGVTAASAIAALQEAGSKLSRDMIKGSYRAFTAVCDIVIELIRQFYDLPRAFRIVGEQGAQFVMFDNAQMGAQPIAGTQENPIAQRLPVFDISVKPQKNNPYSKAAQNEMAMEFFRLGFFNPQMGDQTLSCLEMMDFDGKEEMKQRVSQNAMLFKQNQALMQLFMQVAPLLINTPFAPQVAAVLQMMGMQPDQQPSAPAGKPVNTDPLGGIQPANGIADRVKKQTASRADPNGGRA